MLTLAPFLKKVYIGATFQGEIFFADRCGKGIHFYVPDCYKQLARG